MHALEVLVEQNLKACAREAAHASLDGDVATLAAILRTLPFELCVEEFFRAR